MKAGRFVLIELFISGVLGAAGISAALAADSLLLVNRLNPPMDAHVEVKVDGKKFSDQPGLHCAAELSTHTLCEGPIIPGIHTVEIQVKGGPRVVKSITIRVEDAATNWALVPKDQRLWCLLVTKADFKLASKAECWKIEEAR